MRKQSQMREKKGVLSRNNEDNFLIENIIEAPMILSMKELLFCNKMVSRNTAKDPALTLE